MFSHLPNAPLIINDLRTQKFSLRSHFGKYGKIPYFMGESR